MPYRYPSVKYYGNIAKVVSGSVFIHIQKMHRVLGDMISPRKEFGATVSLEVICIWKYYCIWNWRWLHMKQQQTGELTDRWIVSGHIGSLKHGLVSPSIKIPKQSPIPIVFKHFSDTVYFLSSNNNLARVLIAPYSNLQK